MMTLIRYLAFTGNILFNAVLCFQPVLLLKVIPIPAWNRLMDRALTSIAIRWTLWNTAIFTRLGPLKIELTQPDSIHLSTQKNYLILSNHQSWVDIFLLQGIFHPKTPFLKFFVKRQLIYVPLFGLIWWALGYPFMKRHSREYLEKHPEKKGEDLLTTQRFCQKIKNNPYSIINFVEGTRKTPSKMKKSPFKNLLPAKAGGIATTLFCLDYQFDEVLDVTFIYEIESPKLTDLMAGRIKTVKALVRSIPIAEVPKGDYFKDPVYAEKFQNWLNQVWKQKDQLFS